MNTKEEILIDKYDYEDFKQYEEITKCDFVLKIEDGTLVSASNMSSTNDTSIIEIFSEDKYSITNYNIIINGIKHNIKSTNLFNKIKELIEDNLDSFVSISKAQTKVNISRGMLLGCVRNITIKIGKLIITINGAVNNNYEQFIKEFITEIKSLIINEGEKTTQDYMLEMIDKFEPQEKTELDIEFDKYSKLYEERFGKRAYIAEPGGTIESAINAIKICLEKDKDMLDEIYYPNNEVLYSETQRDLNNDKFVWNEGDIKIAKTQCDFCKHKNNEEENVCLQYPNGKPSEVISNSIKCPKIDNKNSIL